MLRLLLKLPAFMLAVWVMYWSLPLANVFFFVKAWQLVGDRNDVFQWVRFLLRAFGIKVRKYGTNSVYTGGPCMYLSNHRSWADFFIDAYLTAGRGQMMSRMAVMYVFPMFMIPITWMRGCICFKRGSIANKQKFNNWIDKCVNASPIPGICLFPEGHRSRLPTSLQLKRGMLHYAYSRKMPVQIVMTAHKELALDEKRCHVRFGTTCVTGYSEVIETSSYSDFEEFFAALQTKWDKLWQQVFSSDPAELPPLDMGTPAGFRYSVWLKLSQLFWSVVELWLLWWGLNTTWRVWRALAGVAAQLLRLLSLGVQLHKCRPMQTPPPSWLVTTLCHHVPKAMRYCEPVFTYWPLVWLLVSVLYCYDSTLPKPMLAANGTALPSGNSNGSKNKTS